MPLGVIQDDELRLYLADLQGPAVEVGLPKGKACLPTIHVQVRTATFRKGNLL